MCNRRKAASKPSYCSKRSESVIQMRCMDPACSGHDHVGILFTQRHFLNVQQACHEIESRKHSIEEEGSRRPTAKAEVLASFDDRVQEQGHLGFDVIVIANMSSCDTRMVKSVWSPHVLRDAKMKFDKLSFSQFLEACFIQHTHYAGHFLSIDDVLCWCKMVLDCCHIFSD